MVKSIKLPGQDERLLAFSRRLNQLVLAKGWNGADLAREATRHAPPGVTVGRHLASSMMRGAHEPTEKYLKAVATALGVKPEELLPPLGLTEENRQYASATSTLDGRTRLIVDAEVDAQVAQQILALIRENQPAAFKLRA